MLCLWFVIHMGHTFIQEAQTLYKIDPICSKWLHSLKEKGADDIEKYKLAQMGGKRLKKEAYLSYASADGLSKSQDISRSREIMNVSGEKTDSNKLAKEPVDEKEEDVFGTSNMGGEKVSKQSKSSKKEAEKKQESEDEQPEEEDVGFKDDEEMKLIQHLLQKSEVSKGFNTNILKIALNMKETMIASVLV